MATTADDAAKGKQLLRGRTKAKVETLIAELDAARLTLAQAEQVLGERMDDARDTTAAAEQLKQAEDRVRVRSTFDLSSEAVLFEIFF